MFFYFLFSFCWISEQIIFGKRVEKYFATVGEGEAMVSFEINQISTPGLLNYRVITPGNKQNVPFSALNTGKITLDYKIKGEYRIELFNTSDEAMYVSIGSYVHKEMAQDEDRVMIKQSIARIRRALREMYNANLRLSQQKQNSIKVNNTIIKWLRIVCLLPILYIIVGFLRLKSLKSLFTPMKK